MYYFAYGSNMSHQQMKERCPHSLFIKRGFLNGYRFVYDGFSQVRQGAVGNIIQSPGGVVWGGIFEITSECLKQLDKYEGYPKTYDRTTIQVQDDAGQIYDTLVYSRTGKERGIPSAEYRKIVMAGARDCGIEDSYIWKFLGIDGAEQERRIKEVEDEILQNPAYRFYSDLFEKQTATDAARTSALTAEELFKACLDAAQNGDSDAMWAVAKMYFDREGVSKDAQKSLEWRQKAAQAGDSDALMMLARMHDFRASRKKSKEDLIQAETWYRRAAELGRVDAMQRLGWIFLSNQNIEIDAESFKWLHKAAVAGDGSTMKTLASLYRNGIYVKQNDLTALIWYQKAAAAGDASAMYDLALLYDQGHIVARDSVNALKWYNRAADHGHKESQEYLSKLNLNISKGHDSEEIVRYKDKYNLSEIDWMILLSAKYLLIRIMNELRLDEKDYSSISKVVNALHRLPDTSPGLDITVTAFVRDEKGESKYGRWSYLEWCSISVHRKWITVEMCYTEDEDIDSSEYSSSRIEYYPGFESYQIQSCGTDMVDLTMFHEIVKEVDLTNTEVQIKVDSRRIDKGQPPIND